MKIIDQSWQWEKKPENVLELIEQAGRTCYKSESELTKETAHKFVNMIMGKGHESVIEHAGASVRFITNRGVTHELVRHRLCAFSQESTRYVNYNNPEHIEFIKPVWVNSNVNGSMACKFLELSVSKPLTRFQIWVNACLDSENSYKRLIRDGWRPEQAREVLPNSLKTEIVVTTNLREWRHIFKLRTSKKAHPQIRALMLDCLGGFRAEVPILFDDLG